MSFHIPLRSFFFGITRQLLPAALVAGVCLVAPGALTVLADDISSLILTGTVISSDTENVAVILDKTDGKQYLLHKGETIWNAVIEKVEQDRVVLLVAGEKEGKILRLRNRTGGTDKEPSVGVRMLSGNVMPPPPPPAPAPKIN